MTPIVYATDLAVYAGERRIWPIPPRVPYVFVPSRLSAMRRRRRLGKRAKRGKR